MGFVVGSGRVMPDPEKVESIKNSLRPVNKKDMRSSLGLLNFYRDFLPNLSNYIAPLTNLLRKCCPDNVKWKENLVKCFEESIELFYFDLALNIPKPNCKFTLQTDASGV